VAGHVGPRLFRDFLTSAAAMRDAAFDRLMRPRPDALHAIRAAHARLAERFSGPAEGFDLPDYRGLRHDHADPCRSALESAFAYYARLHRHWSRATALPAFLDVRTAYLYGNDFTEETETATRIAWDATFDRIGCGKMD
jgi:hypothetical protein